jgi:hypothetical protein
MSASGIDQAAAVFVSSTVAWLIGTSAVGQD